MSLQRMTSKDTVTLIKHFLKGVCKRHQSEVRLLKPARLSLVGTKKTSDSKNLHCVGQLKSGTICVLRSRLKTGSAASRKSLLERNASVQCVHKHRNSFCELTKASSVKRYARKNVEKSVGSVKDAKSGKIHKANGSETLPDKQPRSYAQIIANYSERMYAQSGLGFLKDGVSSPTTNEIHRSPFSTVSTASLKWKTKDKASRTKQPSFRATGGLQQKAKFSSGVSMARYDCRKDQRTIFPVFGEKNEFEKMSSYASMIEKYSNVISSGVSVHGGQNNMIPKRHASTKLDEVPITLLDAKRADDKSMHVATNSAEVASKNSTEVQNKNAEEGQNGWITKMEDIIKDLKQVTAKKEATDMPATDRWMLQSVNERAHWLDRVVKAHRKMIEDNTLKSSETLVQGKAKESIEVKESNLERSGLNELTMRKSNLKLSTLNESTSKDSRLEKDPMLPQPKVERELTESWQMSTSSKKPSNPIAQYISRGPSNPSTTTNTTSQSPTNASTNPGKEPQIELRMTPSQNESIVSINVDEMAAKTAGIKEQLSVIISSNRNKVGSTDANNLNLRSDFGSMHISISENTIPVKQIEFSINGKPVSELKSIVARADRLDVVSSMDKVEIRIPSSKEKAINEHAASLTKAATSSKPVLNLQIAAKFNEPRAQQPKDTGLMPETSTTPKPLPPPTPSNRRSMFTPKASSSDAISPSATNVKNPENITGTKQIDTSSAFDARGTVVKQETAHVATSDPPTVKTNTSTFQQVSSNRGTTVTDPTPQPSMNIETPNANKTREDRTPSNSIPWWSSEDSFKKIKKKNNPPKSAKSGQDVKKSEKDQESDSVVQNTGQEVSPSVVYQQQYSSVDSSKTAPEKDVSAKKTVVDEKEKMPELPESAFRVIRVRSPPRRMVNKSAANVKTLKHAKKTSGRCSPKVGKKIKYRPNSNVVKSAAATKKELGEPPVSVPHPAKVVQYVSVNPQRANLAKKPEVTKPTSPNAKVDVEEQQKFVSPVETPKVEQESKANAKIEKFMAPQGITPQVGKANVQHSKTLIKETNLEKPANTSAGVSAKSGSELAKGREQDKTDRTVEKSFPKRSETVDDPEDQRLKEILKSMKPIEKKKDGTLIDYGVTVPSRKPTGKFRQSPGIRSKTPIRIEANKLVTVSTTKLKDAPAQAKKQTLTEHESVSAQVKIVEAEETKALTELKTISTGEKIVEAEEVLSVKKDTLTEPQKVSTQEKIVEAEKVLSVRKDTLTEPKKLPTQEKIVEAEKVLSVKKDRLTEPQKVLMQEKIVEAEKVFSVKKDTLTEPKKVSKQEKIVEAEKVISVKKKTLTETKIIPLVRIFDAKPMYSTKKPVETKNSETKQLKEPVPTIQRENESNSAKKTPQKVQTINLHQRLASASKIPELNKSRLDKKKRSASATIPLTKSTLKPSPEISLKTSKMNVTNPAKSSILNKIKSSPLEGTITSSRLQFSEKQGLKEYPKLLEKPGKAPFEGTIVHSARVADKKVPSIDAPPLLGTITFPLQQSSLKTTQNDNRSLRQSSARLEKKLSDTKMLPFKDTINYNPRKQSSLRSFSDANKKKVSSEIIKEKNAGFVANMKSSSSKGEGNADSGSSPGIITGPAGLKSSRSTMMMSTKCSKQGSHGKINDEKKREKTENINEESDKGYALFSNDAVKSEKDILYSSWLHRFDSDVDKDKVV